DVGHAIPVRAILTIGSIVFLFATSYIDFNLISVTFVGDLEFGYPITTMILTPAKLCIFQLIFTSEEFRKTPLLIDVLYLNLVIVGNGNSFCSLVIIRDLDLHTAQIPLIIASILILGGTLNNLDIGHLRDFLKLHSNVNVASNSQCIAIIYTVGTIRNGDKFRTLISGGFNLKRFTVLHSNSFIVRIGRPIKFNGTITHNIQSDIVLHLSERHSDGNIALDVGYGHFVAIVLNGSIFIVYSNTSDFPAIFRLDIKSMASASCNFESFGSFTLTIQVNSNGIGVGFDSDFLRPL